MKARLHKTIHIKMMLRRASLFLSALLVVPLCALAADNERQQPVNLRADRIDIDQKKELSLYHGHVVFSQGTLRLTAALAEVQGTWPARLAGLRSDAAAHRLVTMLVEHPAVRMVSTLVLSEERTVWMALPA